MARLVFLLIGGVLFWTGNILMDNTQLPWTTVLRHLLGVVLLLSGFGLIQRGVRGLPWRRSRDQASE